MDLFYQYLLQFECIANADQFFTIIKTENRIFKHCENNYNLKITKPEQM